MTQTRDEHYLLGHDAHELARLEQQAAILAPATRTLLTLAGLRTGMRVLDLGTGPGDVALLAAELVGDSGAVVGIDRAPHAVEVAQARAAARGAGNVRFEVGDVRNFEDGAFDAVVGRLVLLYADDPAAVIAHHTRSIRAGGVLLAMEYDMAAGRSIPNCPVAATAANWVIDAFARAGLDPVLGARLATLLTRAGLADVATLGMQPYLRPDEAAAMLAGVVRTLLPVIESTGVATAAEVDVASLHARLAADLRRRDAVLAPPTLVGAWASIA